MRTDTRRQSYFDPLVLAKLSEHVPAELVWHGRVWWDYRADGYAVERAPRPVFLTQGDNSRRKTPHVGGCGPPGATYRAARDGRITTPGRLCP